MKALKILLIVIIALAVIVLLVNALAPARLSLEEEIVINAAPHEVYEVVADFEAYAQWNAWSEQDPEASYEISGAKGAPGYKYMWTGPEVGVGYLEYQAGQEYSRIENRLVFQEPFEAEALDYWEFEDAEEGKTKVTWGHEGEPSPFLFRSFNLFMEGSLRKDFEAGLENLKEMVEKKYSGDKV